MEIFGETLPLEDFLSQVLAIQKVTTTTYIKMERNSVWSIMCPGSRSNSRPIYLGIYKAFRSRMDTYPTKIPRCSKTGLAL